MCEFNQVARDTLMDQVCPSRSMPRLLYAVFCNNFKLALELIENGEDVNAASTLYMSGCSVLHIAVLKGHLEIVKVLLERTDKNGKSALHHSTDVEVTRFLIENGAKVNALDDNLQSPLHDAAKNGNVAVAKLLIELGDADVVKLLIRKNVDTTDIFTPGMLRSALENGHSEMVRLITKNGVKMSEVDKDRQALHLASKMGHDKMAEFLIEKGYDVNARDSSGICALHLASKAGSEEIVTMLLDKKADIDATDDNGQSALHIATLNNRVKVAQLLLDHDSNFNIPDKSDLTPLYLAAKYDLPEMAQCLIANGAYVNSTDSNGQSALHIALRYKSMRVAKLLIENRASVNTVDFYGDTPLHVALTNKQMQVAQLLIDKAGVISKDDCMKGLHLALANKWRVISLRLLDNLTDLNSTDEDGETALHLAAWYGDSSVALEMIRRGANVNLLDKNNNTALSYAFLRNHKEVAKVITHKIRRASSLQANALKAAFAGKNTCLAEYLLSQRVSKKEDYDLSVKDIFGRSTLYFAVKMNRGHIVRRFAEHWQEVELQIIIGKTLRYWDSS